MSETINLRLFKHNNPSTNTNQFDVDTALNQNWDKIDGFAEKVNDKVIEMEDEIEEKGQQISNLEQELKLENERLRQDLNALPAVSENGKNITLNGTAEARFKKLGISGNNWQETREGKNLLNNSLLVCEKDGIKIEWKDKKLHASGTSTALVTSTLVDVTNKLKIGKTYIASLKCVPASSDVVIFNSILKQDGTREYKKDFIFTNDVKQVLTYLQVLNGKTINNDIFAQLEEGAVATEYEEYGVTPSSKFPSKIRNCGDNVNVFNKESFIEFYNLTTGKDGKREYIAYTTNSSGSNVFMQNQFKENTQYTISFYGRQASKNAQGKTSGIKFVYTDGTKSEIYLNNDENWKKYKLTSESGKTIEGISMLWAYGGTVWFSEIKLEKGTVATPYSEYGKSNANFTICNKNLFKLSESVDIATFFRPNHGNASLSDEMIKITTTEYNNSNLVKGVFVRVVDIENMIPLDFSKEIIFSFEIKQDAGSTIPFKLSNSYNDKTINLTENYQKISISVLKNSDNDAITLYTNADNRSFYIRNIQLEYETEASDYEEHKEQSFTFPLKEGQVLHLNDYLAEDGVHHIRKSIVLDGVSNGLKVKTVVKHTNDIYYCTVSIPKTSVNYSQIYNSHFKNNGTGVNRNNCYITGNGGVLVLVLEDQTITTVEQANAWLAQQKANGTPVTVSYILAVEEIEEYNEEQQAVYNDIKKTAKSYKGTTNIFSTDEVSPIFDVEALRDLNVLFSEVK